jgi:hypothetical protein
MGNVNTEATNDLLVGVMERQVKRMFIIIIILIIGLIGTNVAWIVYESQFDTYTVTQEAEGEGDVKVSGVTNGDIVYGESEADDQD